MVLKGNYWKELSLYRKAVGCVRVEGNLIGSFDLGVEVRQECVVLPWLFNNIFMYGCIREMKARTGNIVARLKHQNHEPVYVYL